LRVFYTLEESVIADDLLSTKSTFLLSDSVAAFDLLLPTSMKTLADSATIADSIIVVRVAIGLLDEIVIFDVSKTDIEFFRLGSLTLITISDAIVKKFLKFLVENPTFIDDTITIRVFSSTTDSILVDDLLTGLVRFKRSFEDSMLIDDIVRLTAKLNTQTLDFGTVDDTISFKVFYSIEDSVIVTHSESRIVVSRRTTEDVVTIDDTIAIAIGRKMHDAVTIDDAISKTPNYGLFDSLVTADGQLVVKKTFLNVKPDFVTVSDFIAKKFVKFLRVDEPIIDDVLSFKVTYGLFDGLGTEDGQLVIKRTFLNVEPDGATLSDIILKKLVKIVREDPMTIDDFITTRAVNTRRIFDSASVDDIAMAKAKYLMDDSLTVSDSITSSSVFRREFEDSATIDDQFSRKFIMIVRGDSLTIDDLISIKPKLTIVDSATINVRIVT